MANDNDAHQRFTQIIRRLLAEGSRVPHAREEVANNGARGFDPSEMEPQSPEEKRFAARLKRERGFRTGSDGMDDSIGI